MGLSMSESKVKKSISIRLDPRDHIRYQSMVEGAGLSLSDDIRMLVRRTLDEADEFSLDGFEVNCSFKWKKPEDAFPEHVGNLLVNVTPSQDLTDETLLRLVFVIPEFWTEGLIEGSLYPRELFRIDSAYFHRVTSTEHTRTSSKTTRNVLSFHLLKNSWRAAIFDYGSNISQQQLQSQIQEAVTRHITNTIKCYLIGHLPSSRVLPKELYEEMVGVWDEHTLEAMLTPF